MAADKDIMELCENFGGRLVKRGLVTHVLRFPGAVQLYGFAEAAQEIGWFVGLAEGNDLPVKKQA